MPDVVHVLVQDSGFGLQSLFDINAEFLLMSKVRRADDTSSLVTVIGGTAPKPLP